MQCIKFSFSLTAGARFRWINNKSVPHSSSVFACRRGKNTCAPSFDWLKLSHHLVSGESTLQYMRLHFLKLDWEFFCLQPSLARLYSAAAPPSERLRRSDGSLAINIEISYLKSSRNYTISSFNHILVCIYTSRVVSSYTHSYWCRTFIFP